MYTFSCTFSDELKKLLVRFLGARSKNLQFGEKKAHGEWPAPRSASNHSKLLRCVRSRRALTNHVSGAGPATCVQQ